MKGRAGAARCGRSVWVFAILVLSVFAMSAKALAGETAVAVYVEGPDAKHLKAAVLEAVGPDVTIAGEKTFVRELVKAGQKGSFRPAIDRKAIERIRKALRVVGADAVVIVRERRDRRSRWVLWTVLDASDDEAESHKLPLDPKSRAHDAEEIAGAISPSLEKYKPQPEPPPAPAAPAPVAEAPTPAPSPPAETPPEKAAATTAGEATGEAGGLAPVVSPAVETPAQLRARSLLDLGVGGEASGRHVAYRNGIARSSFIYAAFPQLAARASGRLFPLAPLRGPWGDVGFEGSYSRVFLRQADLQGAFATTPPISYTFGLCARLRPDQGGHAVLGVCADYAVTYYGPLGPPTRESPDVTYRSVRPVLETRLAFGSFALSATVAGRISVDPNDISTRLYNPKGLGLDGEVVAAWMFVRHLEARLYGRYERYSFTLTPPPKAKFGKGAIDDELYGAGLALALVL